MEIPHQRLAPETLRAVIAEYVTRESTNYGEKEFSLDDKITAVQHQLENGTVKIVFDTENETCNIVAVA